MAAGDDHARAAASAPHAAPSTLRLALAIGVTGLFFMVAAAALAPDTVMQLLPWRANEAFLPSNATDVARGCSGVDTVPDFGFKRCAAAIGCAARPHSVTQGLRMVRQTSEQGSHRSIWLNPVGQLLPYCLLPTTCCHICQPQSTAILDVSCLPAGSKAIGITLHGCTREGPRSQPSSAKSASSARQPSSRPQNAGAGQRMGSFPSDMQPGSLQQVVRMSSSRDVSCRSCESVKTSDTCVTGPNVLTLLLKANACAAHNV